MKAYIKEIEYYLPEYVLTNEELVKNFPEWDAQKVSDKTGILERHVSATNETAADMAVKAAEKLFSTHTDIRKEDVDFVLLCTQSADYKLPTSACLIQTRLGLPTTIGALDFDLGCSGFVYGLALSKSLIVGGVARNVLLLTAETYTKFLHPKDKGNKSLFGDGAAATLVSTNGIAEIGEFALGTDGTGAENLIVKTGGARYPIPLNEVSKDDGGYILASDNLYMSGPDIFNFTLEAVPTLIQQCLEKNGIEKVSIDEYIFHQANKFMLNTIRKVCSIPKDKFFTNLEKLGNTVSSTIPIALKDAQVQNILVNKHNVLIAGFGVGYSYGACLLKY